MVGSRAAVRYAKAILDVANQKGQAERVSEDMKNISQAISESQELKLFLENPIHKGEVKLNALKEIFANTTEDTKSLFNLLLQNKRFDILGDIARKYNVLFDELKGNEIAYVTTAVEMNEDFKAKVLEKVQELTNKKQVVIENIVNPEIIGGFIIRIGDKQFNASVAEKLEKLKREFTN